MRSAHGKNAKGSKICSIEALSIVGSQDSSSSHSTIIKLLISSADSRIRLYNFRSQLLDVKFKGHESEELPIRACISDDGHYVVAGSEDRSAFIWSLDKQPQSRDKPNQRPVEFFEASGGKTTAVVFAPMRARQLLAKSEDPIYDLCNPPPVTLVSRSESVTSSRPPTESGSANGQGQPGSTPASPTTPKQATITITPKLDGSPKKAPESEAYRARSAHPDGNIIVTASSNGSIRVYRQDCAFHARARQASDLCETGSMWSAKGHHQKKPSAMYMARAMSSHGRGSGGRGAGSVSAPPVGRKRADSQASTATQPVGERILSWRQDVSSSTASLNDARGGGGGGRGRQGSAASELSAKDPLSRRMNRSVSPRKSVGSFSLRSHRESTPPPPPPSIPRPEESDENGLIGLGLTTSPEQVPLVRRSGTDSTEGQPEEAKKATELARKRAKDIDKGTKVKDNPLWLQGGKSYMFWNPSSYPSRKGRDPGHLSPPGTGSDGASDRPGLKARESVASTVSKLSSEEVTEGEEESGGEVQEGAGNEKGCAKCHGKAFREGFGGEGEGGLLVCVRCGTAVERA